MSRKVLVPLAPGFEEIETITVVDILRRAGARVTLAGTEDGPIKGSRGVFVVADQRLGEVLDNDFDLVMLPGGQPGVTHLQQNADLIQLLQNMDRQEKHIAAICAAPLVLRDAGVMQSLETTSHPSIREQLTVSRYSDERVVVDGRLVTSRSPGTAMEFAFKLVEILFGPEMVDKVNAGVMARI